MRHSAATLLLSTCLLAGSTATAAEATITALALQDGVVLEYDLTQPLRADLANVVFDTGISGYDAVALAADPSGTLLVAAGRDPNRPDPSDQDQLFLRIDLAGNSAETLDLAPADLLLSSLTFGPDGELFGLSFSPPTIHQIDTVDGTSTPLLDLGSQGPDPWILLGDGAGLYIIPFGIGPCPLLQVDVQSGTTETVQPDVPCSSAAGALADDGTFVIQEVRPANLATYRVSIDRVDPRTGEVTSIQDRSEHFSVPEVHGLARVRGQVTVVEVPFGRTGRILLIALLALVACRLLGSGRLS